MTDATRSPLTPAEANDQIRAVLSPQQVGDYVSARRPILLDPTRPNQARVTMLQLDLAARLPLEAELTEVSIDDAQARIEFTIVIGRRRINFTA